MRTEFPKKVRLEAWNRCGGNCENCGVKLMPGKFQYDHIVADTFGGEPVLSNCAVLCSACHAPKTRVDNWNAKKSNRIREKHLGIKRPKRPMPGSKASGWKRKMDGTMERRTP